MGNMSNGEMWAVFFITLYWFTGLWRITKQLPVIIRSGLKPEKKENMNALYSVAMFGRMSGLLTSILVGIFIYYDIPLPKIFWAWVILGSFCTLYIAGKGRDIIGGHLPTWITGRPSHYEGFGESLGRLPETSNENIRRLFEDGQNFENSHNFDKAIITYEKILAADPTYVKCLTAKGILHCMKNELQEGRNLFLRAVGICPNSAFVYHLLARVEKQMGIVSWQMHEAKAQHNLDVERAKEMINSAR